MVTSGFKNKLHPWGNATVVIPIPLAAKKYFSLIMPLSKGLPASKTQTPIFFNFKNST